MADSDREFDVVGAIFGDDKGRMTINQAQRVAKDMVTNGTLAEHIHFDIVGPGGRLTCQWLDPHLGFFEVQGKKGFMLVSKFEMYHDLHVEQITVTEVEGDGKDA
ncbi:hypothetical protein LCGC14_0893110 [marine sediment metagenome]|uniref:Uncharacterized protein n=1 Tax=marine sediment metagenome TaxID=412755 RepID=A0A0F9PJD3_9ZZZZ